MRYLILGALFAPLLAAQTTVYQGQFLHHEVETVVERRCDAGPLFTSRNTETTGALAQISFDQRTFTCPWASYRGSVSFLVPSISLAGVINSFRVELRTPPTATLSASVRGTGSAPQAPNANRLGLPNAPTTYFFRGQVSTNGRDTGVNQSPRCPVPSASQEQRLTAAGSVEVSVQTSCGEVQFLAMQRGSERMEGGRVVEFLAQFDTYAFVWADANSLATTNDGWRGVHHNIFVRSIWKFTAEVPADAVTISNTDPASGAALFQDASQVFRASVQTTLASRPTGAVQLRVADQSGAVIGSSTPVSLGQGTSTRTISTASVRIPAGATRIFLTGVLLDRVAADATVLKESTPVAYAVGETPDISIDHIEVVQVVQDRDNTIPLIADKDTVARVFLRSSPARVAGVTGRLRGFRDGRELPDSPQSPDFTITTPLDPQREDPGHSLQFRLPKSWVTEGDLELTAEAPGPEGFGDGRPENNTFRLPRPAAFRKSPFPRPLRIYYFPYCLNDTENQKEICPSDDNIAAADSLLSKILPVPASSVWYLGLSAPPTLYSVNEISDNRGSRYPFTQYVSFFLSRDPFAAPLLVFWLPPIGQRFTPLGGYQNSSAYIAIEEPDARADRAAVGAHRIARYAYSVITRDAAAGVCEQPIGEAGFDTEERLVVPSSVRRLNAPCDLPISWISPEGYKRLVDYNKPRQPASRSAESDEEFAIVSGVVDPGGAARLNPVFRVAESSVAARDESPGEYCLRLSDKDATLLERCFALDGNLVASESPARDFSQVIPFVRGATRLALLKGSQELTAIEASASVPSVSIQSPGVGESWEGGRRSLVWTATDADGDALRYTVVYSLDKGESWFPLRASFTESSLEIRPEILHGGGEVLLRVLATDGFHTASATVGPITVVHSPRLQPSAQTFDVGNVPVNNSREAVFQVLNSGTGPATITSVSVDNSRFTAALPRTPFVLPAGGHRSVRVRYTAPSAGIQTGTLALSAGENGPSLRVPLRANGVQ